MPHNPPPPKQMTGNLKCLELSRDRAYLPDVVCSYRNALRIYLLLPAFIVTHYLLTEIYILTLSSGLLSLPALRLPYDCVYLYVTYPFISAPYLLA